jgi:hypothetical protein
MTNANAAAIGLGDRLIVCKPLPPLRKPAAKSGFQNFCRKNFKKLQNRC